MEYLTENKTIVIIAAIILIVFLLLRSDIFHGFKFFFAVRTDSLGLLGKLICGVIIVAIAYRINTSSQ